MAMLTSSVARYTRGATASSTQRWVGRSIQSRNLRTQRIAPGGRIHDQRATGGSLGGWRLTDGIGPWRCRGWGGGGVGGRGKKEMALKDPFEEIHAAVVPP